VTERVREEGLPDADGAEDHGISVILDEAKGDELVHDPTVVGRLRALVPALEHHVWIQSGLLGSPSGGVAIPPRDLVDEEPPKGALQGKQATAAVNGSDLSDRTRDQTSGLVLPAPRRSLLRLSLGLS
jgi:hypothetical protein